MVVGSVVDAAGHMVVAAPPVTSAVLITLAAGPATLTVMVNTLVVLAASVKPATVEQVTTGGAEAQVQVALPPLTYVRPAGKVSVTVIAPVLEAVAPMPIFFTVNVYTPLTPIGNGSMWVLVKV